MELTMKGNVCRNPDCVDFRHPYIVPHASQFQLEKMIEGKSMRETVTNPPARCCPKASFDVRMFFESMQYIGSVKSRTNQYFVYENNDVIMASTGIKEMIRFNAIRTLDLEIIKTMILKTHHTLPFDAMELRDTCLKTSCKSQRITDIQHLERQGKAEHNDLYWIMLTCCYLLSAKGILSLQKEGHSVLFEVNEPQRHITTNDSIYNGVKYLANLNVNTAAFAMDPFYLEVRCNGYRGSIVPYFKEEIEYLNELIELFRPKHKLDIADLRESMDYSHRFLRLYDLLGWRNLRNDRDEQEFFDRRIKSALELVAKVKGTVKADKEGRTKVFYKR
jgi:hypothetical protein